MKIFVTAVLLLFSAGWLAAQTNERVYEELDFRFVTPGARAIGMGKTFVGLADDATAAYSNPAGLSNLLEQEVSFELTGTDIRHHRFVPSDTGQTKVFGETVVTPSFFSYAYPHGNFTLSFSRNVVQDYKEQFSFRARFIPSINHHENGASGDISLYGVNYGLGVSYLLSPKLSFGLTGIAAYFDDETRARTGNPERPRNGTDTDDSGFAPGAIVGVLYKPHPRLTAGAVYNTGSHFNLTTTFVGKFIRPDHTVVNMTGIQKPIYYVIPRRVSFGLSWQRNEHLTLATDGTWIQYSQQVSDKFLIADEFQGWVSWRNFYVNDAYEFHAGGEYRFYHRHTTYALRGGLFTDPEHQLHFRDTPDVDPTVAAVEDFRFNTLKQGTTVGYTFGGGIAFSNRFQFDVAFSLSRNAHEAVLSFVTKL